MSIGDDICYAVKTFIVIVGVICLIIGGLIGAVVTYLL